MTFFHQMLRDGCQLAQETYLGLLQTALNCNLLGLAKAVLNEIDRLGFELDYYLKRDILDKLIQLQLQKKKSLLKQKPSKMAVKPKKKAKKTKQVRQKEI